MKYLSNTLFMLSGLGLAVSAAVAQEAPSSRTHENARIHEVVAEYDMDGSMTLSEEEFAKLREERLQGVEMPGQPPEAGGEDSEAAGEENLFGQIDLNRNGELDVEELTASVEVRTKLEMVEPIEPVEPTV